MARSSRRPGTSRFTTQRQEPDQVRILSGVYNARTTGTPIHLMIDNVDAAVEGLRRHRRRRTAPATPTTPMTPSTVSARSARRRAVVGARDREPRRGGSGRAAGHPPSVASARISLSSAATRSTARRSTIPRSTATRSSAPTPPPPRGGRRHPRCRAQVRVVARRRSSSASPTGVPAGVGERRSTCQARQPARRGDA